MLQNIFELLTMLQIREKLSKTWRQPLSYFYLNKSYENPSSNPPISNRNNNISTSIGTIGIIQKCWKCCLKIRLKQLRQIGLSWLPLLVKLQFCLQAEMLPRFQLFETKTLNIFFSADLIAPDIYLVLIEHTLLWRQVYKKIK